MKTLFAFDGFNVKTAVGGDVDAWLAQMSSGNCGGTTPPESPTPDTPEEDDGEENDSDGRGKFIR